MWNETYILNEKRTKNKSMNIIKSGPVQWSVKALQGLETV